VDTLPEIANLNSLPKAIMLMEHIGISIFTSKRRAMLTITFNMGVLMGKISKNTQERLFKNANSFVTHFLIVKPLSMVLPTEEVVDT